MKLKYIIPLVIFIGILGFFWKGLTINPHIIPSVLIGKPLPQFTMPSLNSPTKIVTNKQFRGQVILLNVWATWCTTCRAEQPIMLKIARSKKVILVGLNYKDQRPQAKQWLKQFGNPFKINIFDPKGILGTNLGVYGTPETFVIDKKGIIRDKIIGAISPNAWAHQLLPLITRLQKEKT